MSLSPKKESESNEDNSNECNPDEPKIYQEQRRLVDPSTDIGSKPYSYHIYGWNKWINTYRNIS